MLLARKGHWPMQLLAHGSFRQSSVLTLHVVYREGTNKHNQMQKVVFETPNQLTKEVPGTGRLGACAGSPQANLLTPCLPHADLALIQTFLRRIHFFSISKLFIWLGKIAALSRSLYTCLGNFCSNFCFGHKSKITAVCLWVH